MRQFFETYLHEKKLSPVVREISWTNNLYFYYSLSSAERNSSQRFNDFDRSTLAFVENRGLIKISWDV